MKKDISILIGNALDCFDISLYGFLAPVIGSVFFPDYDPTVQLILTYATSITSLISRPLGTFIFGALARHKGPLFGLSYSLIGVAIATVCIGCIPSYGIIGLYAPLSLVVIKIIRDICAAGESIIAKLYIMENKSYKQSLMVSYLYQSSSMLGVVMASALSTIVINRGGDLWRICFCVGGVTGFVGYFLRYYTVENKKINQSEPFNVYKTLNFRLMWDNRVNIVRVAIATCFSQMTYAVPFVFMNNFVPFVTSISLSTMMALNTHLLVVDMMSIPVIGRFTMHYCMYKVMISAATVLAVTIIPLFIFLPHASLLYVTCMRLWIVFWGLVFLCPLHCWFNSLFKTSDKYFLVGMGNVLAAATFGYMTTPICLWLWYATGISYIPALYMVLIMSATICAVTMSQYQKTLEKNFHKSLL